VALEYVVEELASKLKALSSNPTTTKKQKEENHQQQNMPLCPSYVL
jgi:hypothetical protein